MPTQQQSNTPVSKKKYIMKTHLIEQRDEYDEPHTLCEKMSPVDSAVWSVETFTKSPFRCDRCWKKYMEGI